MYIYIYIYVCIFLMIYSLLLIDIISLDIGSCTVHRSKKFGRNCLTGVHRLGNKMLYCSCKAFKLFLLDVFKVRFLLTLYYP